MTASIVHTEVEPAKLTSGRLGTSPHRAVG